MRKDFSGVMASLWFHARRVFHTIRTRNVPEYQNPSAEELIQIEHRLLALDVPVLDLSVSLDEFEAFIKQAGFPVDYHGGANTPIYREKLLEHFVAWKLLAGDDERSSPYVDVAAGESPWVKMLRERGVNAYAVDLSIPGKHAHLEYYRQEDATNSTFEDESVGSASLQCAYEMFAGDHDIELLKEFGRILKPGGRVVISPLYMHTHACYYQTPEWYGKYDGDSGAVAYVRRDCWDIPASRKYSPETFRKRVWEAAFRYGLTPSLHILRNKKEVGSEMYLHFVLVIEKPNATQ